MLIIFVVCGTQMFHLYVQRAQHTLTFHIACDKVNDDDGECIFMLWHLWFMFTFGGFIFRLSPVLSITAIACHSQLPASSSAPEKMNFLNFLHRLKMAHFIFVFIFAAAVVIAAAPWKCDLFVYSSSFYRGLLSLWPQGLCVADFFFGRTFRHRNIQSVWQQ